jgi:hypothetical protein
MNSSFVLRDLTISTQRHYQHSLLNNTLHRQTQTGQEGGFDQIILQRYNYASIIQVSPPSSTSSPLSDQFILEVLSAVFKRLTESRDRERVRGRDLVRETEMRALCQLISVAIVL